MEEKFQVPFPHPTEYTPYDKMKSFWIGVESYADPLETRENPYNRDSVDAQAWDRGLEYAMKFCRIFRLRFLELNPNKIQAKNREGFTPPLSYPHRFLPKK